MISAPAEASREYAISRRRQNFPHYASRHRAGGPWLAARLRHRPSCADRCRQAGPDYNIGSGRQAFHPWLGRTPQRMVSMRITAFDDGCFSVRATPTAADIATERPRPRAFANGAPGELSGSYTNNSRCPGATQIQGDEASVNTSTDANGNFSVFGKRTLQAIGSMRPRFKNDLLAQPNRKRRLGVRDIL